MRAIGKPNAKKRLVITSRFRFTTVLTVIACSIGLTAAITHADAVNPGYEISSEAVAESIMPNPTLLEESLSVPLKSAKTFKVTYYCSACNSPRGTNITAMGDRSPAFIGSCASNNFPLGSTIYLEGQGTLLVNDRMGSKGKIDIYLGDRNVCTCDYEGTDKAKAFRMDN